MDKKQKLKFFTLGFHKGNVNQLLHAIGIVLLIYAIYIQNIIYVLLSIGIMELGHWYQYRNASDSYKSKVKEVIKIQVILIILVISILSVYFYY